MRDLVAVHAFALAVALALGGAAALAQAQRDAAALIARADADGDGAVSRDEMRMARESAFARLDRNADGALTSEDAGRRRLAARRGGERLEEARAALDTDGDGRISRGEFVDGPMRAFELADANADSVVDAQELEELRARAAAARSR